MKKYLFLTIILFGINLAFGQTTQKLGYVDMSKISEQLPEAIKAKADLETIAQKWQGELDSMNQALQTQYGEWQKKAQAYQEKMATLTKAQKDKQEKDLKAEQKVLYDKDQEVRAYQQQKFGQGSGEYYAKQEELLKPIRKKISDAIQQVASEEKVQFVFDKSGDLILPYADPAFDLTYKVLDKLKRGK